MVFKWNEPFSKIVSSVGPAYFIQDGKKYRDAFPPQIPQLLTGEPEDEPTPADVADVAPKGKTVKSKKKGK